MDTRAEIRDFLVSRRSKLRPEEVGLSGSSGRRVPGLRREEVAVLAGMSAEYYARVERGALGGASAAVLEGIARALQLTHAEREHLFRLAQAADGAGPGRVRRRMAERSTIRPALQRMIDAIDMPAIISNGRLDLLAANHLGRAFYADVFRDPRRPPNYARFNFLDETSRRFWPEWDLMADVHVAILRTEAGRDPHSRHLQELVGELSTRSEEFRRRWGAHDVRQHGTGMKQFDHAVVGELSLSYEGFDLVADPGLSMTLYAAEAGSTSAERLRLLGSWAATQDLPPVEEMQRLTD